MTLSSSKTQAELATLMMLSPFVIATRMTEFWMTAASPTARSKREASRMVAEKMSAMGESAVAMQMAATKVMLDSGMALLSGVHRDGGSDADDVLSAGLRPYTARVKANRRRLSR